MMLKAAWRNIGKLMAAAAFLTLLAAGSGVAANTLKDAQAAYQRGDYETAALT